MQMKKDDINVPVTEDRTQDHKTPKYKRILAIIGIVIFGSGIIGLVASFIASGQLENVFQMIALVGLLIGFMIFLFLYMSGSMPFKREKRKEEERIRTEYQMKMAELEAEKEREDKGKANDEKTEDIEN